MRPDTAPPAPPSPCRFRARRSTRRGAARFPSAPVRGRPDRGRRPRSVGTAGHHSGTSSRRFPTPLGMPTNETAPACWSSSQDPIVGKRIADELLALHQRPPGLRPSSRRGRSPRSAATDRQRELGPEHRLRPLTERGVHDRAVHRLHPSRDGRRPQCATDSPFERQAHVPFPAQAADLEGAISRRRDARRRVRQPRLDGATGLAMYRPWQFAGFEPCEPHREVLVFRRLRLADLDNRSRDRPAFKIDRPVRESAGPPRAAA